MKLDWLDQEALCDEYTLDRKTVDSIVEMKVNLCESLARKRFISKADPRDEFANRNSDSYGLIKVGGSRRSLVDASFTLTVM